MCIFSYSKLRKCLLQMLDLLHVIVMVTTITTHTNIANSVTHCKNYDEFSITASFKVKG